MKIKSEQILKRKFKSLLYRIINYMDNNNCADSSINGEKEFVRFICNTESEPLCFFDIGANKGYFTDMILGEMNGQERKFQIHMFEPMPETSQLLKTKYKSFGNVFVNGLGVSDSNEVKKIYFDSGTSTHASIYNRTNVKLENSCDVRLIRLEDYIKSNNIKRINFIKIDVEGHEYSCLKGLGDYLKTSLISYIQFEYGGTYIDSQRSLKNIYDILGNNWKVCKLMKHHLEAREYNYLMDNYSYANYIAVNLLK